MSNPRIEEVSDSDPEIDDPEDFLPNEIMRPVNAPAPQSSSASSPNPTLMQPPLPAQREVSDADMQARRAEVKPYASIYPIYFSKARSRHDGRRVSKKLAIDNPLAFSIFKAVRQVIGSSLRMSFEPDKTHPKDWSNPGRVKVQLFGPDTHKPLHPTIKNRKHLYNLVAEELVNNPTRPDDPLELKLQGLPVPENFLDTKIAVPRGWKMGNILPIHSAAVSGGGVSDNFLKEAMEEMKQMQAAQGGGQLPAGPGGMDMNAMAQMMQGMGGMGGFGGGGGNTGGSSKKKDKKKG
ncbi:signal recognition particle subunit [Lithohypha guttulata]|uniref:Signal recognition particle subunit n=1 Tax=Lithohypha guttulata TaxID=1690604 RepID=A0AAN7TA29_9EURO|nr:signal recognition particle subunit [Lithohypha guttulata]